MQYLFGDRELQVLSGSLLQAVAEVIVCEGDAQLRPNTDEAVNIQNAGGDVVQKQCRQLIREYTELESGMALFTDAGALSYSAIVHVISPQVDTENPLESISRAVGRSLLVCETNGWKSIAFPALGLMNNISLQDSALAFHRAITRYWDARLDSSVEKVMLFLTEEQISMFSNIINEENLRLTGTGTPPAQKQQTKVQKDTPVGYVEIDPAAPTDSGDIEDWFK